MYDDWEYIVDGCGSLILSSPEDKMRSMVLSYILHVDGNYMYM